MVQSRIMALAKFWIWTHHLKDFFLSFHWTKVMRCLNNYVNYPPPLLFNDIVQYEECSVWLFSHIVRVILVRSITSRRLAQEVGSQDHPPTTLPHPPDPFTLPTTPNSNNNSNNNSSVTDSIPWGHRLHHPANSHPWYVQYVCEECFQLVVL